MALKIKTPFKDVDTVRNASILRNFMWVFPFLALLGLVLKGILGVLIAIPVSAVAALIAEIFSGLIGGGVANLLYGTGRRNIDVREQLSGTISQARCYKMSKDFEKALTFVEEVLGKDPDYPEALYLKAQILLEGYRDTGSAQTCLKKILLVSPDKNDTYHRWALSLLDDIETSLFHNVATVSKDKGEA